MYVVVIVIRNAQNAICPVRMRIALCADEHKP